MLESVFNYPYFVGTVLFFLIWVFLFTRCCFKREMVIMGALFGVAAVVIGQWYALVDYWQPTYLFTSRFPLEDFLYGFFFGGSLASLFEYISRPKKYKPTKKRWMLFAVLPFVLTLVIFYVSVNLLGLNSIIAHIIPPLIIGGSLAALYPHLLKPMIITGGVAVLLTVVVFQILLLLFPNMIDNFWMLENLSGILLAGVPLEEYLFAFALGFSAPFVYESIRGCVPYWS